MTCNDICKTNIAYIIESINQCRFCGKASDSVRLLLMIIFLTANPLDLI